MGCETWCIQTPAGEVTVSFEQDEKLTALSPSETALSSFINSFFRELSRSCKGDPELVMVLLSDRLLPITRSKVAVFFLKVGLGALVFAAIATAIITPLAVLGAPLLVSIALAYSISVPVAATLGSIIAMRALPRWKLLPGQPLRVAVAKLKSLEGDLEFTASLAKFSILRRQRQVTPAAIKSLLESWGVPVKEVRLRDLPNPAELLCHDRAKCPSLFLTTSREVSAISYWGLAGSSGIVLGVDVLIDLEPSEMLAVVAHELSHLKHRDSLTLAFLLSLAGCAAILNLELLLSSWVALLATVLASAALVSLTMRAMELRADLEAALTLGKAPVRKALIKLEYSSLVKSHSISRRLLDSLVPTIHPPAWLRLVALENSRSRSDLRAEAVKIAIFSPLLAFTANSYLFNTDRAIKGACWV